MKQLPSALELCVIPENESIRFIEAENLFMISSWNDRIFMRQLSHLFGNATGAQAMERIYSYRFDNHKGLWLAQAHNPTYFKSTHFVQGGITALFIQDEPPHAVEQLRLLYNKDPHASFVEDKEGMRTVGLYVSFKTGNRTLPFKEHEHLYVCRKA